VKKKGEKGIAMILTKGQKNDVLEADGLLQIHENETQRYIDSPAVQTLELCRRLDIVLITAPVVLDFDTSVRVPEDAFCSESVFESLIVLPDYIPPGLFEGGKPSITVVIDDDAVLPSAPADPAKRVGGRQLVNQEDLLLKRLAERYLRIGVFMRYIQFVSRRIETEKRLDWSAKSATDLADRRQNRQGAALHT